MFLIRRILVSASLAILSLATLDGAALAQSFDTKAPYAVLMDYGSGTILFDKAGEDRMAPASMGKLMTAEYVFHQLQTHALSMDDEFTISENAWRKGGASTDGSTMFAKLNSRVAVHDLLRGLLVQSGNDAAIAFAEGIAGSEIAFADRLNQRAKEIGLSHSHFANATGLPDSDEYVTAHDLALLARHIIQTYPDYYPIFAEPQFTWNKITQRNRNPLLSLGVGADGLKTGATKESGYGLVGSAVANSQRLIVVVNGLKSMKEREAESRNVLEWGFRSFRQITAFKDGETVTDAKVFGGVTGSVPLQAKGAVTMLIQRSSQSSLKAQAIYQGPLKAPVGAGAKVGVLRVTDGDKVIQETPLFTTEAVAQGSLKDRAISALDQLLLGWL
ncbi:D-alanyl-D-alanine carboxypeptidase (penicillin-binding protein 5/6) [Faunimonas pinastri]|uniref:serine-type D-Ala-D-Ala carboxypeptidase n=1 Tax=Faunimonas pinastri TaxID=1855383 RepID=A0A1H9N5N7_9HYPH|nr:D-alanyl-D-alanine carboxypeptidase family protein [Faunimonas pinastri]SER31296.1 D-alanyl-D-alanine carboxypeptidase (penicillin-binding protein 5/6) [Faunimonas pinastri]